MPSGSFQHNLRQFFQSGSERGGILLTSRSNVQRCCESGRFLCQRRPVGHHDLRSLWKESPGESPNPTGSHQSNPHDILYRQPRPSAKQSDGLEHRTRLGPDGPTRCPELWIRGLVRRSPRRAEEGLVHRTKCRLCCSNHHENVQGHGRPVRSGRFFFATGSTSRRPHHRSINAPQLRIELLSQAKAFQNLHQGSVLIPLIKTMPHRLPRPKGSRQVTPRSPGSQYPQNAVHNRSLITGRTPHPLGRGKHLRNQFPLLVRKPMPNHDDSFHLSASVITIRYIGKTTTFQTEPSSAEYYTRPLQKIARATSSRLSQPRSTPPQRDWFSPSRSRQSDRRLPYDDCAPGGTYCLVGQLRHQA